MAMAPQERRGGGRMVCSAQKVPHVERSQNGARTDVGTRDEQGSHTMAHARRLGFP